MSITSKTRKMLWGRAANRCAICRIELVMNETETDDESIIGDECHIIARELDGSRGESMLSVEQRDKYNNLILLCKIHHKNIDDQPGYYTVEALHGIKGEHENWVRDSLNLDIKRQQDEEVYMTFVERWSSLCDIENWKDWTSWLLGAGGNKISTEMEENLQEAKEYIFTRIWPERYQELNNSFENFRKVLDDLLRVFHEHSQQSGSGHYTEKFYKIREWDPERYHRLLREYEFHTELVQDLVLELTRAGNFICDMVRKYLLPSYRMNEGLLIVESGPYMDMSFRMYRTQYRGDERTVLNPYPGVKKFKKIRVNRDVCFGVGTDSSDPKFLQSLGR
jgi:hypothetical protein